MGSDSCMVVLFSMLYTVRLSPLDLATILWGDTLITSVFSPLSKPHPPAFTSINDCQLCWLQLLMVAKGLSSIPPIPTYHLYLLVGVLP